MAAQPRSRSGSRGPAEGRSGNAARVTADMSLRISRERLMSAATRAALRRFATFASQTPYQRKSASSADRAMRSGQRVGARWHIGLPRPPLVGHSAENDVADDDHHQQRDDGDGLAGELVQAAAL